MQFGVKNKRKIGKIQKKPNVFRSMLPRTSQTIGGLFVGGVLLVLSMSAYTKQKPVQNNNKQKECIVVSSIDTLKELGKHEILCVEDGFDSKEKNKTPRLVMLPSDPFFNIDRNAKPIDVVPLNGHNLNIEKIGTDLYRVGFDNKLAANSLSCDITRELDDIKNGRHSPNNDR